MSRCSSQMRAYHLQGCERCKVLLSGLKGNLLFIFFPAAVQMTKQGKFLLWLHFSQYKTGPYFSFETVLQLSVTVSLTMQGWKRPSGSQCPVSGSSSLQQPTGCRACFPRLNCIMTTSQRKAKNLNLKRKENQRKKARAIKSFSNSLDPCKSRNY